MERIKQALDKARAERKEATSAGPSAQLHEENTSLPVASSKLIQYSQTAVQSIDPEQARGRRIILGNDDKIASTAYKMLRTQVLQRMTSRGWNALAVTSPAPEDGKTVTSINLAISLAREIHHTVLLVDMDLRNPSIHKYLGIRPTHGIGDYLVSGIPMSEILINPGIERLVVLPGRMAIENSSEILASPAMGKFVSELKSRYPSRMVIFDLPPILSADDAIAFSPFVDAFLMVIRDAKSTKSELEHAMQLMKDATILGTVLNASDEKLSTYY